MYIGSAHGEGFSARRSPLGARVHRASAVAVGRLPNRLDNEKGSTCGVCRVESYYEYDMYNII
jgi:hypothetical protein